MTIEAERAAILLDALGLLIESEEDVAIRVRARLLLAELDPALDAYRRMNGTTEPPEVLHPSLVAKVLPGLLDEEGRVTNKERLEGAVAVLRWLAR